MLKINRFVVNPFQENCYIISDETNETIIIDCGVFFTNEREYIIKYIDENKLVVKHLLATHGHVDHNFGNNTIYDNYGIKPLVHENDKPLMATIHEQALVFCNHKLDYDIPEVGRYLKNNDTIEWGNHILQVIHTPGHSPGSVIYYCREEKTAFTGDTLFNMSIGRTDLQGGSINEMRNSLKLIKEILPEDTIIMAGHGDESTMKKELFMNPYLCEL